jgi:hypothetical protein
MIKIQEYTNICIMLQYKLFAIETPELRRVKVKFTLEQATKSQRRSIVTSRALLFNLGSNGGLGGQRHVPAALPPRKTRYPLYSRLVAPQSRSGQVRKVSPPPGFDPRTV